MREHSVIRRKVSSYTGVEIENQELGKSRQEHRDVPSSESAIIPALDADLTGRELDAAVAERVMGEPKPTINSDRCTNPIYNRPIGHAWAHVHYYDRGDECEAEPRPFSISIDAAMEVETCIAELGLQQDYLEALESDIAVWYEASAEDKFRLIHATAEQRCRAALAAVALNVAATKG